MDVDLEKIDKMYDSILGNGVESEVDWQREKDKLSIFNPQPESPEVREDSQETAHFEYIGKEPDLVSQLMREAYLWSSTHSNIEDEWMRKLREKKETQMTQPRHISSMINNIMNPNKIGKRTQNEALISQSF